jgi:hypothetical protein
LEDYCRHYKESRETVIYTSNEVSLGVNAKSRMKETTRKTQDVVGWIILKWIVGKMVWYGLNRSGSRLETSNKHTNESSVSIK